MGLTCALEAMAVVENADRPLFHCLLLQPGGA